jgi:hypothetical protein
MLHIFGQYVTSAFTFGAAWGLPDGSVEFSCAERSHVPEAAMILRLHRRNLVVWSQSVGSAGRYDFPPFTRDRRIRRFRASIRLATLLPVIGLTQLERVLQARWRPVLAGAVLTVVGVTLRGDAGGVVLLPGLMFLLYAPFIPASPDSGRRQRRELRRELAAYSTAAQRRDLEASLDRYPDQNTAELRDILHDLAMATRSNQVPGARRY